MSAVVNNNSVSATPEGDLDLLFLNTVFKEGSKIVSRELLMLHLKCTCITLPQLTPPPPGCHFTKRTRSFCRIVPPVSKDLSEKLKVVDYSRQLRGSCGKSRPHERCHLAPYGGQRQLSFYWGFHFTAHQLRSWRTVPFLQQATCSARSHSLQMYDRGTMNHSDVPLIYSELTQNA